MKIHIEGKELGKFFSVLTEHLKLSIEESRISLERKKLEFQDFKKARKDKEQKASH